MKSLKFVPLKPEHARITPYLRQVDLDEIEAMTDLPPEVAVAFSIAQTERGFAAEVDGELVALFGISNGLIWLVATDEINKYPITFYRLSRKIFPSLIEGYDYIENYVDARNTLSLRWLKWLGFTIKEPKCINNGIFHHIYYKKEVK